MGDLGLLSGGLNLFYRRFGDLFGMSEVAGTSAKQKGRGGVKGTACQKKSRFS